MLCDSLAAIGKLNQFIPPTPPAALSPSTMTVLSQVNSVSPCPLSPTCVGILVFVLVLFYFSFPSSLSEYFIDETNPVPLNSQTKQDRYLIPPLSCTQTYSSFSSSSQGPHMYLGKGGVLLLLTCVLSLQCSGSSQKC